MTTTMRDLEKQIAAAQIIREQVVTLAGDDPDFIRDAIEGETSINEIIAALAEADGEDDAILEGIAEYQKKIAERKSRIENRQDTRRALIASAMELAELKKLETPAGTVSLKATASKTIITDESQIPSDYFETPPPKLNKTAVSAALKEGRDIPGATLSNGGKTIQIRR
jgi:hypothetical protein